eukprot:7191796-Karenia_brevis.AAC.1
MSHTALQWWLAHHFPHVGCTLVRTARQCTGPQPFSIQEAWSDSVDDWPKRCCLRAPAPGPGT